MYALVFIYFFKINEIKAKYNEPTKPTKSTKSKTKVLAPCREGSVRNLNINRCKKENDKKSNVKK